MIRLRTLGALDLRDAEGHECRTLLAQTKRVALLVYLALASSGRPQRRDALLALFWPELDAERARNALSQATHFLRRALGPETLVNHNGDELSLVAANVWCDATAFEDALTAGRVSDALELYRGDLLEGFHVGSAPEFDKWLEAERSRLADKYVRAAKSIAEKREATGDMEGAVALWRRLAARDPYSGQIALQYIRALAASGDRSAALQHARVHEMLLREELNASPDEEFASQVRLLQSSASPQKSAPAAPAPPVIPAPLIAANTERAGSPPFTSGVTWRRNRSVAVLALALLLTFITVAGALAWRSGPLHGAPGRIRSLAVLPFDDLSGDSAQQSFVDGMHDALITELARYPELSVISRTSMLRYRSSGMTVPEIARELKVDGIVEGAILRDSGRIRMSAQLVHGPSNRDVWAERYERDLRDVLVLQAELAAAIAGEVRVATYPERRISRKTSGPIGSPPRELFLRELYLRGRHAELSRSLSGLETAREAYRSAIAQDSTFALGWAGLAGVYGFMADYGYSPMQPALDSARILARHAVALDSTLPETRTALGVTLGDAHDFEGAEREFKRAIELGPSYARAHYWYAILLAGLGRGAEAMREAERALALDPFTPRGGIAMRRYATYLLTGDNPHRRLPVDQRRPILKLEPGEPWARATYATDLAEVGRCGEARTELSRARQGAPGDNFRMLPSVGMVQWWCGERDSARVLLARMKTLPYARENGYRMAMLHVVFSENDSAFVWLERQRWTMAELSALSAGWILEPLRADPRYPALLQRLKLRARS